MSTSTSSPQTAEASRPPAPDPLELVRTFVNTLDLETGETLHTIDLGKEEWRRSTATAWQKVENRLFVVGPGALSAIALTLACHQDRQGVGASVRGRQG